jgi:YVTN family beta-propeller protein
VGTEPLAAAVTPDATHVFVANANDNTVSVIATATNKVLTGPGFPIPVGDFPRGIAVTPDGKHVYVTNANDGTVSVIDTATNPMSVVATLAVGGAPVGVAVTPDGTRAYVANFFDGTVSVIDTATNTVEAATLTVGNEPYEIAITPDGKHAYVTIDRSSTVSVIDTATNIVEAATLAVGTNPTGVVVTPDGKHTYVANYNSNSVSVIDTATNTVELATLAVGTNPAAVAINPDGKHVYIANFASNNVSVIATANNKVVATVTVGSGPFAAGIVPPPPGVPFLAFSATLLDIAFGAAPNTDSFNFHSLVTQSSTAVKGINPVTQPVTLQVGTFTTTIPAGSFTNQGNGSFTFTGVIGGVSLDVVIRQAVTLRYAFNAGATGASLTGTKNPVYVTLIIGAASGAASVTAEIQGHASPL